MIMVDARDSCSTAPTPSFQFVNIRQPDEAHDEDTRQMIRSYVMRQHNLQSHKQRHQGISATTSDAKRHGSRIRSHTADSNHFSAGLPIAGNTTQASIATLSRSVSQVLEPESLLTGTDLSRNIAATCAFEGMCDEGANSVLMH